MGVGDPDECDGDQRYGGTRKRDKRRHRWSRRDMQTCMMVNDRGKFPKIQVYIGMGTCGHGWSRMHRDGSAWVRTSILGRGNTKMRRKEDNKGHD